MAAVHASISKLRIKCLKHWTYQSHISIPPSSGVWCCLQTTAYVPAVQKAAVGAAASQAKGRTTGKAKQKAKSGKHMWAANVL